MKTFIELAKLLRFLYPRIYIPVILAFGLAIFEVAAVLSIFPFFAALNGVMPDNIASILRAIRIEPTVMSVGLLSTALIFLSAVLRSGVFYHLYSVTNSIRTATSVFLFRHHITDKTNVVKDFHLGDYNSLIISESDQFANSIVMSSLLMLYQIGMATLILISLLVVGGTGALTAFLAIGVFFALMAGLFWVPYQRAGLRREQANSARFRAVKEGFSDLIFVRSANTSEFFVSQFTASAHKLGKAITLNLTLGAIPKFFVEALGIAILFFLAVSLLDEGEVMRGTVLPYLGFVGFSAYRLIPSAQAVYQATTQVAFHQEFIHRLRDLQDQTAAEADDVTHPQAQLPTTVHVQPGKVFLETHKKHFEVPEMVLSSGNFYGLWGPSGVGKTTLLNLITGLIDRPEIKSQIEIGGVLHNPIIDVPNAVGYVAQKPFLIDKNLVANIALDREVDKKWLRELVSVCELEEIWARFERKDLTSIGDDGKTLSGGQRQRIAIARALYTRPALLILDEALSGLNEKLAARIIDNLRATFPEMIVILVSHNARYLERMDAVLEVDISGVVALKAQSA